MQNNNLQLLKDSFDDETNGGVVLARYTVTNDTDNSVYYTPSLDKNYSSGMKYVRDNGDFTRVDGQLYTQIFMDRNGEIKAGETVKGYTAYPLGTAALETVMNEGSALIDIPAAQRTAEDLTI